MMASTSSPIRLQEAYSLFSLGISATSLTFATTTLSSDQHVVIQDRDVSKQSSPTTLVIIPTKTPTRPIRRPFSADAVLMHPSRSLLALRMGVNVRLFDIEKRHTLQAAVLPAAVSFWRWINHEVLAIVTDTAVFHWRVGADEPVHIFDRHASLASAQIVAYVADRSAKWLAIVGITPDKGKSAVGSLQLFSVDKRLSQILPAHAATFAYVAMQSYTATLFVFASRILKEGGNDIQSQFRVIEVEGRGDFAKASTDIYYPPEFSEDFPISLLMSSRYPTIAHLITRMGYIHLYDVESAKCIYMNRVSSSTLFATTPHNSTGGILGVNRAGQVLIVSINPDSVVRYVREKLGDEELAHSLASRNGFAGAEAGFLGAFEDAMQENAISRAATLAAESPGGCLRTKETIARFLALRLGDSAVPPVFIYFKTCLDRGKLNAAESIELSKHLIQAKKVSLLEKWIKEDKLEFSEALGDVLRPISPTLALAMYIKASVHEKVIQCMIQTRQTSKVALYAKKVGMNVSHRQLVDIAAQYNSQAALDIANNSANALVLADPERKQQSLEEVSQMIDMFLSKGMLGEATTYAMENLRDIDDAEGHMQTKVLKACLTNSPAVADGILSQDIWHRFDSFTIAMLCERAGLFQHALEHYTDLSDVKRVITNTHVINPEFILQYFGTIHPDDQLEVLKELIVTNPRANIRLCVNIAAKYTDVMGGPLKVIPLFEGVPKVSDALYYYLSTIVASTSVPEVHNRFIQIAVELGQFNEAEQVTRESNYYDPELIKKFLKDSRPRDPRALINVCDRFGYVDELVEFFVKQRQVKFIEGYVQRINPTQTPAVVGALLDSKGMRDGEIEKLILSVKNMVPIGELVSVVQSRGKLNILLKVLEARLADGTTDVDVHSGLAKVYIDTNRNAQHFLETNVYYDSRDVGQFCSKRDPMLAFTAFRRGNCDEEVLQLTNDHSLFREQAAYAVDRADKELWAKIFDEGNPYRRLVMDQVISTAMPQCKQPDKVSVAVRAFLEAGMPHVLMELLEKLVMQTSNSAFARNTNLQNLLILTAIGAAPERVKEYVRRMDNYDGLEVAPSCVAAGLFEEAYTIYVKFEHFDAALDVLLDHIGDLDRAHEFAMRLDRIDVWIRLGIAQLAQGIVADGIRSIMRAKGVSQWAAVVATTRDVAVSDDDFKMACKFLRVARKKIREPEAARRDIDTELVYALCRLNALTDAEEIIISPGSFVDLEDIGDRCFDLNLLHAAKMMFRAGKFYGKLAHTLVKLGEYKEAVSAARKANRLPTWRVVCFGCVDGKEFALAAVCMLRLVVEPSELDECVEYYEERGHFDEVIDVLLKGVNLARAHEAMFTLAAVLLSKYREESVLDFCRLWRGRINGVKVRRACETAHLWPTVVFLYMEAEEYDHAANCIMDHSPSAFSHGEFLDVVSRVGALSVMYRSIDFYLGEQPELLSDLLNILAPRVDGARATEMLRRARREELGDLGCLPFGVAFLEKIQTANVVEVNEALNAIYEVSGSLDKLTMSVREFNNFNQLELAARLEGHVLLQMRRIASEVFARNGRHEQAITIAERDEMYEDMMYAIAQSNDTELAETYAWKFAESGYGECMSALLYSCYDFFAPDVAAELAWQSGMRAFAMPFFIQTLSEAGHRLTGLEEERRVKKETETLEREEIENDFANDPSVLLYGLQPREQQLMLTYEQAGGGTVGGAYGGTMKGGNVGLIGWN